MNQYLITVMIIGMNYLAIEPAKLVLPTPGGPTKHSIFPFNVPFILPTAMNSNILSCIKMSFHLLT